MAWKEKSLFWRSESPTAASISQEGVSAVDNDATVKQDIQTGELTLDEAAHGGLGRHLGLVSTTFLIIGRIIGTGIFSTPSSIASSVGSVGASMFLWLLGLVLAFCGQMVWLEFGCMFPRSGGEKVYLEAVYRRPKFLATIVFAVQAILLGFTASGCIVFASNIIVAADSQPTEWQERGIAIAVIVFVTLIHTFIPKVGVQLMNALGWIKVIILAFIVVTGWVVLGGCHTGPIIKMCW
ncbi:amino acid permease-domain-containing protein [Hypoxylon sp. FL0890]|nr:amino acid permease-domain-containing protein [Hypoxylon sp. FL0890]